MARAHGAHIGATFAAAMRQRRRRDRWWERHASRGLLIGLMATMSSVEAHAQADPVPPAPYLTTSLHDLNFSLPALPSDPLMLAVELDQVRAAQFAEPSSKDEAFADADAYPADLLLQRFSVAAGESLNRSRRPILAHMLRRVWGNTDSYSSQLKLLAERPRPFVVDYTIQPCDVSYLSGGGGNRRSYPSGHAVNGYIAALLLSDVMTGNGAPDEHDRTNLLIARGVRYGTNRVVCGAHYPSDVAAGQLFARFLYPKIAASHDFQADLICARQEDIDDRRGTLSDRVDYTPDCKTKSVQYATERH